MQIRISKQAEKFIKQLDRKTAQRILLAMDGLREKPLHGDIKSLKGNERLRLRVGDFRIIFREIDNNTINVIYIKSRGDAYK
ncbi:MAG: type II toxin-antitoxin system RelE/ParE family toxin [Eubacteriales bacterium]